jgi:hypothetical protein
VVLVDEQVGQFLNDTAGPLDLQRFDPHAAAKPEVQARVILRQVGLCGLVYAHLRAPAGGQSDHRTDRLRRTVPG